MNSIVPRKTSGALRLLADQIDNEEQPDFVLIINNPADESYSHIFRAMDSPFSIIGVLETVKRDIIEEQID